MERVKNFTHLGVLKSIPRIEATGGTITNIQDGGNNYKVHTFTASGSFVVSDLGSLTSNIEYLVVAGGGSGGQNLSGGGGAGGLRTNLSGHPLAAPSYQLVSELIQLLLVQVVQPIIS